MNETVYRKAYKTQQFYSTQEIYSAPGGGVVSYAAVFSGGVLRDVTKNGCVGD